MPRSLLFALLLAGCATPTQPGTRVPTLHFQLPLLGLKPDPASSPTSPAPGGAASPLPSAPTAEPSPQLPLIGVAGAGETAPPGAGGGGSGGGNGGGAPAAAAPTGQVVALLGDGETPLADATVRDGAGHTAQTDSNGYFRLPPGTSGTLIAGKDGFLTSAVTGLTGAMPVLHLRPAGGQPDDEARPSAFAATPFTASGRLVDDQGQPVEGVEVALQDADGSFALPVPSEADGSFNLSVMAVNRRVTDGTLLAVGGNGTTWMGLAEHVAVSAGAPHLADLAVVHATQAVDVTVTPPSTGGTPRVSLVVTGPAGQSLALPAPATGPFMIAPTAGLSFAAMADVSRQHTRSTWYQELDAGTSSVNGDMLPVPAAPRLDTGTLAWDAVPGATAYRVTVSQPDTAVALWEAFTLAPTLLLDGLAPASASYDVLLEAHDGANLSPRQVASVKALRTLPLPGSYRSASRVATVSF